MLDLTKPEAQEIVEDAIYQISTHNGPIRRYVRAVKVYGEGEEDEDLVECEIIKCKSKDAVGKIIKCAADVLVEPDQYPKYMFNPQRWLSKVNQSRDAKWAEVSAVMDAHLQMLSISTAALDMITEEHAKRTVESVKSLLMPIFGGFTLALFVNLVKSKIFKALEARHGNEKPFKPFKQKVSELNRIWSKKSAADNMKYAKDTIKDAKPQEKTNKEAVK